MVNSNYLHHQRWLPHQKVSDEDLRQTQPPENIFALLSNCYSICLDMLRSLNMLKWAAIL